MTVSISPEEQQQKQQEFTGQLKNKQSPSHEYLLLQRVNKQ